MGIKIIEWLIPPKQKKQTKPMTKSEQMNHATRQAFLRGRKLMENKITHREWMARQGKAQTE
jgi:hypothetical protein